MARKPHKYHYIYKTTCNVTGKYYIGMHSCSNLEDGYMGSGKRLKYSLNKHGIENHTKEILEFLDDRDSLAKREREIVNENMIQDSLCMNITLGGRGASLFGENNGFFGKTRTEEHKNSMLLGLKSKFENEEFKTEWKSRISSTKKEYYSLGGNNPFRGKSHSEETKEKMRNSDRTGNKNSQFGTCWINNGTENKKIKKEEQIPDGWKLGRKLK
jgi:hypothetical protein